MVEAYVYRKGRCRATARRSSVLLGSLVIIDESRSEFWRGSSGQLYGCLFSITAANCITKRERVWFVGTDTLHRAGLTLTAQFV